MWHRVRIMAATPHTTQQRATQPSPLGGITLVTGPEEFLNDRVVQAARAAVRRADSEAEVSEVAGEGLTPDSLGELSAPSLFSATRCLVVRRVEDAPEDVHDGLVSYATAPEPDIALVLVHSGGAKGTGLLNRLRKLPTVQEHKSEKVKAGGLGQFLQAEARRHRARLDPDAGDVLVEAIGDDLRGLAAAVGQLAADFPDQPLTRDVVGRYFSGRVDVKGYEIADLALNGHTAKALEELRWALTTGVGGPAITGSFASSVRQLARLAGAGNQRDADVARDVGVPPWKLKSMRVQLRGWDADGLGRAIRAVATADADVKGAGADAAYALEQMVLTITGARLAR